MTSEERRHEAIEHAYLGPDGAADVPASGIEFLADRLSRAVGWHLGSEGAAPPAPWHGRGRHGAADAWTSSTLSRHLRETA